MDDRWQMYDQTPTRVATGWRFEPVTAPSRLGGSNGMTIGPDGRLYVTQVFASQVTAIDVDSGAHEVFSPLGGGIVGPDDGIFAADGTFFATEPLIGRVSARQGDGSYRVVRDDLPGANGITVDHAGRRLFVDEFRPGGRLMELDPSGAAPPRVLMEDLNGPNALAMGPDGRLYFPQVFANQIWVYDLEAGQGRAGRRRPQRSDRGQVRLAGADRHLGVGCRTHHRHRPRERTAGNAGRSAAGHRQRVGRAGRPDLRRPLRGRPGGGGDGGSPPDPVAARVSRPPWPGRGRGTGGS